MDNQDKKMSVLEFVKGFEALDASDNKAKYIEKKAKIKQYIPYNLKQALASNIVQASSWNTDHTRIEIKSWYRHILFIRAIIENYTELEITSADFLEEYDALVSSRILECILALIPENEINDFKEMLDSALDDFMTNEYETRAFISGQVNRVATLLQEFASPLISQLSEKINSFDEKDIAKITKKLDGIINRVKK